MGCIVLMAVRHRDLDKVALINPASLNDLYNADDFQAKTFTSTERRKITSHENVIISQYYESTGKSLLYINHDFLLRPKGMGFCHEATPTVEDLVPSINMKEKIQKRVYVEAEGLTRAGVKGEAVSIFELDLDSFSQFSGNPFAMKDVAHYCETGQQNPRTFGRGIKVLDTAHPGEAFLVLVDRWWFKVAKIRSREFCFGPDEAEVKDAFLKGDGIAQAEFQEQFQEVFMREFMAGIGYVRQAIAKKPRKPAPAPKSIVSPESGLQHAVYCASVTEYEGGYGNRPDGFLIAIDRESFDIKAKEINSDKGNEFSRTETLSIQIVTPECYLKLKEAPLGYLWLSLSEGRKSILPI